MVIRSFGLALLLVAVGRSASQAEPDVSAIRAADERLNQAYQIVSRKLDNTGRSYLKSTERAWVQYKESDFDLLSRLATMAGRREEMVTFECDGIEDQISALQSIGSGKSPNSAAGVPVGNQVVTTTREADQMLNDIYRRCLAEISQEYVRQFKESEALWIAYRDLYCRFDSALKGGRVDDFVLRDLTVDRMLQLRRFFVVVIEKQLPVDESTTELKPGKNEPVAPDPSLPDVFRFAK